MPRNLAENLKKFNSKSYKLIVWYKSNLFFMGLMFKLIFLGLHVVIFELLSLVILTLDLADNDNLITSVMGATTVYLFLLY